MDFEKILHKASRNEKKKAKEQVNCYRTSFSPPKKEEKTRGLSANIQKFLARREEDERRKKNGELKKKEELLALRNQDNKAKKRVQVMLKRTKSANKSVLDDAIDTVNTADTLNGPQQCDEDDYGYVSQEASKFYKQMMEKYSSVPVEEKKFSKPNNRATAKDLVNTKDRVKQALLRQEEEEHMPHKRKRRHKDKDDDNHHDDRSRSNSPERTEEPEKPKPKRPAMPPPLDFSSLLKIAEKKQYEPVVIEKKIVKKEKEEPERLMTKREKMEFEKQREREKKIVEHSKPSSSKPIQDDSPRSSYDSREPSNSRQKEAARPDKDKYSSKEIGKHSDIKSKEKERLREKERGHSSSTTDRKRLEESNRHLQKSHHSNIRGNVTHSKNSPQSNTLSPSRSRSRSPHASKDQMLSNGHTSNDKFQKTRGSPSCDHLSSSTIRNKDDIRRNNHQFSEVKPSSLPRIPKISRTEEDRRLEGKYMDKERIRDKEKIREREKELERQKEKERERAKERERGKEKAREREREREKERERDRGKEKERERERERENERERLREKEKQLEREREKLLEMQRELEREREKAKERERMKDRESEKERQKRDRDYRESSLKRPHHSLEKEKPKLVDSKKPTKYDKLDLFGDRDSPEAVPTRQKTSHDAKTVKVERIKIVEDTTRDLFDNPVTIVRKQSQIEKPKEKSPPRKSSSVDDKSKSSASSSRPTSSHKSSSDKDKARIPNHNDRKRDAEDARYPPDKKPRLDSNSPNKSQVTKDTFKKPLPPKQFPPKDLKPKEFPPRDLQRKQFPPRDLQRKRFPPSDLKSRKFPPSDVRRGLVPRKRFEYERSDSEDSDEDEEDEYASDLDDFIDDGPAEDEEDYSKYIKDIFGYDKSKYRDDDEDIEESSFAEQMREECRSARLGLIEDLEDMAMEQREKRHKALMRMKRGRR